MTDGGGKQGPANDNHAPDAEPGTEGDAAQRLDAVVLSIARLIGRQLAREHFEALRAANNNIPKPGNDDDR